MNALHSTSIAALALCTLAACVVPDGLPKPPRPPIVPVPGPVPGTLPKVHVHGHGEASTLTAAYFERRQRPEFFST